MIPPDWTPVHRADGEQVGWLAAEGVDRMRPLLLTGAQLADARPRDEAAGLLRERGLAALDRRWWARLPAALPPGVLPAAEPLADWAWQPVVLVEVSPAGCTVRPEWPAPRETGRALLPVPVAGLLVEDPPS